MVDFKHWYDTIGNDKVQAIIETIEELELPYKLKEMILNTIIDAEGEIIEDMYEGFISDYQDICYDEYKDNKYDC